MFCNKKLDNDSDIYCIPITEDLDHFEGNFCSLKCTIFYNDRVMSLLRPFNERDKRKEWILEMYKNEKKKKNKKFVKF